MKFQVGYVPEGDIIAAVCLDKDIVAQGNTQEEARERWTRTMMGQIALDKKYHPLDPLLSHVPATPNFYKTIVANIEEIEIDEQSIYLNAPPELSSGADTA